MNRLDAARDFGDRVGDGDFARALGFLLFLLVIAALVVLGVWLFGRTRRGVIDDPLRHAAARYGDGKITRVEFERIQSDLATAAVGREAVKPTAWEGEGTAGSPDDAPSEST